MVLGDIGWCWVVVGGPALMGNSSQWVKAGGIWVVLVVLGGIGGIGWWCRAGPSISYG